MGYNVLPMIIRLLLLLFDREVEKGPVLIYPHPSIRWPGRRVNLTKIHSLLC